MAGYSARELIQKNLVNALQNTKITRKKLADTLNVSPNTVSNWSSGYNIPSLEMLDRICHVLNIPIQDMFVEDSLPIDREKNRDNYDVIVFQVLHYIRKAQNDDLEYQYSLQTRTVPKGFFPEFPVDEMRLLHLYDQTFTPTFQEDDLLLLHIQETAEDGDMVLAFRKSKTPGIYKVKKEDERFVFLSLNTREQSFKVDQEKIESAGICAKLVSLIRDY